VWDQKFRFGIEGATAYKDQVKKLGGSVAGDMPLDPDRPSYGTEAQHGNDRQWRCCWCPPRR
jgi:hypothetical protein